MAKIYQSVLPTIINETPRLAKYDHLRLVYALAVRGIRLLREYRDQHGRSFAWAFGRKGCAAREWCLL